MPSWLGGEQEPTLLVTADQVVSYRGTIREKPTSQEQCREFLKSYADEPAVTVSSLVVTNTATGRQAVVRSTQRVEVTMGVSLVSPLLFGLHAVGVGGAVQGTDIAKQHFLPLPVHVIDQLVADPLMMSTAGAFRIESGSVPLREPRICCCLALTDDKHPPATCCPCRGDEAVPWAPRGRRELYPGPAAAAALPAAGRSPGWHASRRRCRRTRVRLMLDVQTKLMLHTRYCTDAKNRLQVLFKLAVARRDGVRLRLALANEALSAYRAAQRELGQVGKLVLLVAGTRRMMIASGLVSRLLVSARPQVNAGRLTLLASRVSSRALASMAAIFSGPRRLWLNTVWSADSGASGDGASASAS